jgi:hypothetical protein
MVGGVVACLPVGAATVLHVSPTGTSLAEAMAASRRAAKPVTIYLHAGTYFLDQPLTLATPDSGLTLAAWPSETPVISGGRRVTGWRPVRDNLWAAPVATNWDFRELWVNGRRAVRARQPNRGLFKAAGLVGDKRDRFQFRPGEFKRWPDLDGAEVVAFHKWVDVRLPIVAVDETNRIVTFTRGFRRKPEDNGQPVRYYIENAFAFLDVPGEFYLNRQTATLYYRPRPDEDLSKAEVIAPVLTHLVELQDARGLRFHGLTFAHCEWQLPANDAGDWQAAIMVPAAIQAEGARDCRFENCVVTRTGTYGIQLGRGCRDNRIRRCEFADLGGGGVKIGTTTIDDEPAFGNEVSDCHIHDGGKVFHHAVGVWIGQSHANRLAHNTIHDFYYSGISIGWTWGYGASMAYSNVVEFNHVHHIGALASGDGPLLSDMGAIYTLGKQPGTVIRNNLWHDIAAVRYGGWAIYFDEGSSGIVAENNLVYRTTHGGFHQHYGQDNIVRNNIFAFGRDQQLQRGRKEAHRSFIFERNIVYWTHGMLLTKSHGDKPGEGFQFDTNLYFNTAGKPVEAAGLSYADWQQRGQDARSLIADPQFVAPAKGDFRLRRNSPAGKIGFQPFDLRAVGPRG